MVDLESGLHPRYSESNNSTSVLQYANQSERSTPAGFSTIPSPMLTDGSSIIGSENGEYNREEWGPQHPCYPHLNPHVPLTSPLFSSTRVIRIQRDWMLQGDLAPTFSNLYPEVLDTAGVTEQEFRHLLEILNKELIPAFNPLCLHNIIDGIMSALTGWLWEDAGLAKIKERLRRVEKLLEEWNQDMEKKLKGRSDIGAIPKALPLRRTGYMTLDIQVPNPEISSSHD
ncbi:putative ras modification protein erf4 [Erysiphe neolycopersici]|uniref:Ras modification protein ERF4 n=1 Tax=Erysiphe neolycopersici TaxID=212602 RepID=A0A420I661_9PEZI|nr:putative ras modification protein erf4 [Erysiphe neolycopersici]